MTYDPVAQLRSLPEPLPLIYEGYVGWHVRLLRRLLINTGNLAEGEITNEFDEQLELAVREFQTHNGLQIDGVVGNQTWGSLKSGHRDRPQSHVDPQETIGQFRVIATGMALLLLQLGVFETDGPNRGEVVDAIQEHAAPYLAKGYPWCVALVDFIIETTYRHTGGGAPFNIGVSSSALFRAGRATKRIVPWRDTKPGDLIVFRGGRTGHYHTGIVYGVEGEDIITIEGNTDIGGSGEGDGIYRKVRRFASTPFDIIDVSPR